MTRRQHLIEHRDHTIRWLHAEKGYKPSELAVIYNLTRGRISQILKTVDNEACKGFKFNI